MTILAYRPSSTFGSGSNMIVHRKAKPTYSKGTYKPNSGDFLKSFYAVLRRWQKDTAIMSSPTAIKQHEAFEALVKHAELAMPLILKELHARPSNLVWVLNAHADERPFPDEANGDIAAMSKAWVNWGERNGCVL